MRKLLLASLAVLLLGVWGSTLYSQTVPSPGPPFGIACAFNTVPPTLTTASAGWVQCDNAGQLKTTASFTASSLNVTVTNTTAAPVFVSNPNGFGGTISGGLNVTVTNVAGVSELNSAAILAAVQASVPTGTNNIGTVVAGLAIQTASTPTVSTNNYVSGNCMGGFNSITLVNNAGGSGYVTNFMVTTNGTAAYSLTPSVSIYLFDSLPAGTCTDRGTFLLQTGDLDKLLGGTPTAVTLSIPVGMTQGNANATFSPPLPFIAGGSSGSGLKTIIYALVSGSTVTLSNTTAIHVRAAAALN